MHVSTSVVSAVLIILSLARVDSVSADSAAPQQQLKTYPLHNSPNSADISPDERLVVTECTMATDVVHSDMKTLAETVQLWNFREDRLVAEFPAERWQVAASSKGFLGDPAHSGRIVRFSPNGNLVVAVIGQTIHVLRATDLVELRKILLVGSGNATGTVHARSADSIPRVTAAEISPTGNAVAILWVRGLLYGKIELYDLSSGRNTISWDTPIGWVAFTKGLSWHPNGKLLVVAIPNQTPCLAPDNKPDVFAFDVQTGVLKYKFSTGLLAESIAVTEDSRALAVDGDCLGVLRNHDPKLKVFDLITGKHLLDVSGRDTGVRYVVSASADGSRFLAFTGKMKTKFDWGDFVPSDVTVDKTFSVWNLNSYEGIVTSQNMPGLVASTLRLSTKGRYAVSSGKSSAVYELP